ncbi:hypothetical protein D3C71_1664050 [compost metagenome]
MVRKQDRPFVAQCPGNQLAFLVAHRHARPAFEKRAVVIERAEVHVGNLQRHFQHRQGCNVGRMGVNDAVHIRSGAVHPTVKTIGRVGHAVAFEHLQVFVDQQQVARGDFVETQAQLLSVVSAGLRTTGGDLSGKAGIVTMLEQDAAGQGQLLPGGPRIIRQGILHLAQRVLDQLLFGQC